MHGRDAHNYRLPQLDEIRNGFRGYQTRRTKHSSPATYLRIRTKCISVKARVILFTVFTDVKRGILKKFFMAVLVIVIILIGVTAYVLSRREAQSSSNQETQQTSSTSTTSAAVQDTTQPATAAGAYVTLNDYTANPASYSSTKKIYFFHAPWCPICKGIDQEITADKSRIPLGTTIIKTDFDTSTDLRKKYGVTYQYTFVQVDNDGNELKQWSALDLNKALAGIQ